MSQGRLEQLAAPAELYANPATPFVAEFVGLNNKVPAEVSGGRAQLLGTSVPALDGSISAGSGLAMVRPESVTVSADPAGTSTVSSVAFLGPISRVYCTLEDGSVISAQMASSRARAFAPGAPVSVGVEPTGVLVVAGDGPDALPRLTSRGRVPAGRRSSRGARVRAPAHAAPRRSAACPPCCSSTPCCAGRRPCTATASRSPGWMSAGSSTSRAISSPDSHDDPRRSRTSSAPAACRLASATVYFAPYRATRGLSDMPPSTATNVLPSRLRLHRHHPIERHAGAGADRATRLDHDPGPREPLGRARPVKRVVDEVGELGDVQLRVTADVRNAMSAADVELGAG